MEYYQILNSKNDYSISLLSWAHVCVRVAKIATVWHKLFPVGHLQDKVVSIEDKKIIQALELGDYFLLSKLWFYKNKITLPLIGEGVFFSFNRSGKDNRTMVSVNKYSCSLVVAIYLYLERASNFFFKLSTDGSGGVIDRSSVILKESQIDYRSISFL